MTDTLSGMDEFTHTPTRVGGRDQISLTRDGRTWAMVLADASPAELAAAGALARERYAGR